MANPNVAVAITKQTTWHGATEQYSNVYHFDGPPVDGAPASLWTGLINDLTAAEKPIHGTNVTFKTGRVWSVGGTKQENVTLALIDLTGTGSGSAIKYFKEAAVLVEWECARLNIDGRKVYLRKYIRACAVLSGATDAEMQGENIFSTTVKGPFKTYADKVQKVTTGTSLETFNLVSPNGRLPKADNNGVVNNYMISREFRQN